MKHDWAFIISTGGLLTSTVVLALDNWRLRRRLRVDRLAQEAEEALGPPHIGDIDMPDPSDPRWKFSEQPFTAAGVSRQERVLALGAIYVTSDGHVYIGAGAPVDGGQPYGRRVLHAYRRRLVEQARGSAT